jgi:hypothetical protein
MTTQLLRFEVEGKKYRVMSKIINKAGDVKFYVERYLYNTEDDIQIWALIEPGLIDKNNMTLEQCVEILHNVSQYVNENYGLINYKNNLLWD